VKYAAVIDYIADKDKVDQIRPAHRQYLAGVQERGQLAASGPFADGSGALIVYEVETAEAAEALLKGDPFHVAGVMARWQIRPWIVNRATRELF
jgi:hypothetical protein